jgi:hypothetical protein
MQCAKGETSSSWLARMFLSESIANPMSTWVIVSWHSISSIADDHHIAVTFCHSMQTSDVGNSHDINLEL